MIGWLVCLLVGASVDGGVDVDGIVLVLGASLLLIFVVLSSCVVLPSCLYFCFSVVIWMTAVVFGYLPLQFADRATGWFGLESLG